jgi:hypothetical protein
MRLRSTGSCTRLFVASKVQALQQPEKEKDKVTNDRTFAAECEVVTVPIGASQHFRGSTIYFPHRVIKKTIWDLAVEHGPGRRCYSHSG